VLKSLKSNRVVLLAVLIFVGTVIRVLFTFNSSGPDILQFYAFARTFDEEKWCFYLYADVGKSYWPYNWEYCYPPLWLFYLFLIYKLSGVQNVVIKVGEMYKVDIFWVTLVKLPLLISDIIITLLIARYFKDNRGLVFAALWYLNPTVIYISSIFGMFDQVVTLFILLTGVFYEKKNIFMTGLCSAIAILLKQYALFPIAFLILHSIIWRRWKHALKLILVTTVILIIPFLPFIMLCGYSLESLHKIINLVLLTRSSPYYPKPYCYNFNGITGLLTWIHENYNLETIIYFKFWFLIFIALLLPILYLLIKKKMDNIWIIMFCVYSCFIISLWRINYQYLIPLIALGLFSFLTEKNMKIRIPVIISSLYPALWFFIFPVSFWFYFYISNPNLELISILNIFSLRIVVNEVYIVYSIVFTGLLIITYLLLTSQYYKMRCEVTQVNF